MNEKEEYKFDDAEQGPVIQPQPGTTQITIRVDTDTLNWFRSQAHQAGGGNCQTLINEALRLYIQSQEARPERTPKRITRKKLQSVLS